MTQVLSSEETELSSLDFRPDLCQATEEGLGSSVIYICDRRATWREIADVACEHNPTESLSCDEHQDLEVGDVMECMVCGCPSTIIVIKRIKP